MIFNQIVKPLAEKDIAELYVWYNKEREGLGEGFLDELEISLKLTTENPFQYQVRYKGVRMKKIQRFPVCLHFTIEDKTVFVHAILSTSRNPRVWEKRS